jgi:hypothetical protein
MSSFLQLKRRKEKPNDFLLCIRQLTVAGPAVADVRNLIVEKSKGRKGEEAKRRKGERAKRRNPMLGTKGIKN